MAESSSRNNWYFKYAIPSTNIQDSKLPMVKRSPVTQVHGNPSSQCKLRRQLATDLNWEELHQFDRLQVWELVDKPFGKNIIKKDEDQTVTRNKARLVGQRVYAKEEQDCTAMSSAEAEYVALSASFSHRQSPCNPWQPPVTSNIHTRYHFIKEQVENGIIELYFVRTEYQLADMFTKALPEERFQYLVRRIGMRCLTPAELEVLTKESA
ncbi:hypothetical protein Tco_0285759 [Tanacetum coccineum]